MSKLQISTLALHITHQLVILPKKKEKTASRERKEKTSVLILTAIFQVNQLPETLEAYQHFTRIYMDDI